jgi:adenylosuccinate synthase
MCITKLDVLDGMEKVKICVAYDLNGQEVTSPPCGADRFEECQPVYIEMPGWQASTVGLTQYDQLPQAAKNYLEKVEALCGTPIDIISTGPDRNETIIRRHPFDD